MGLIIPPGCIPNEKRRFVRVVNTRKPDKLVVKVQSFQSMFSIMLTVAIFALVAFSVNLFLHTEIPALIQHLIQAPLVHLTTNLSGFLVLTTIKIAKWQNDNMGWDLPAGKGGHVFLHRYQQGRFKNGINNPTRMYPQRKEKICQGR